jgi:hypothetical protein
MRIANESIDEAILVDAIWCNSILPTDALASNPYQACEGGRNARNQQDQNHQGYHDAEAATEHTTQHTANRHASLHVL